MQGMVTRAQSHSYCECSIKLQTLGFYRCLQQIIKVLCQGTATWVLDYVIQLHI